MRFTLFLLFAISAASRVLGQTTYLEQGWNEDQRDQFYFTPQGSQLIPYTWFLELEQAGNDQPFRGSENMRKYGMLPAEPTSRNPSGLPIGFVRDGVDEAGHEIAKLKPAQRGFARESTRFAIKKAYLGKDADEKNYPKAQDAWFGLTCAACHTNEIEYEGKTIRIDGGSTQADFESFLRDLGMSLETTHKEPEKFERFATRLGRSHDLEKFRLEVVSISDAVNRRVERNKAEHPYGFARLDAFGAILNAVCEMALDNPANHQEANAPVSYPSLWNTPDMGYVQWDASAAFPEGRNVGEVLGVFGFFSLEPGPQQFDSTIRLHNLITLERDLLAKLKAPDWPEEIFGKLDQEKVKSGQKLFQQNCQSCHSVRDANGKFALNSAKKIPIRSNTLPEVRTDPQFMKNLVAEAETGELKSIVEDQEKVKRVSLLLAVVRNIMAQRAQAEQIDLRPLMTAPQDPPHPTGHGYISRPLEGIWANAPYFHNGSVPNLYETLLPANERSKSFWVGSRKFDPKNVGFVTAKTETGSQFNVVDENNQPIPGNSNGGHEGFGANQNEGFTQTLENGAWREFTDPERYALVEYMKSLSSNPVKENTDVKLELIPEGEAEKIANIVDLTTKQMQERYKEGKRMLRGVHPKDHGCVTATFEVLPDLPAEYAVGVFQPGAKYDAYIRFSNAAVRVGPDSETSDAGPVHGSRGMAVKLLGVEGESLLPLHGALTQDFLMVNQPAFAFANVEDYEVLSQVLLDNNDNAIKFFEKQLGPDSPGPEAQKRANRTRQIVGRVQSNEVNGESGAFSKPPASPVDNPYFSAAPFLFGEGRVMKFRVSPVARSLEQPDVDDPNYLRTALIKRLEKDTVEFDFAIQIRNPDQLDIATDIENASTEWADDFIPVARITIPPQPFDAPEQRVKCERLFFSPWHGIVDHRPLGGINRLRKAVYIASSQFRNLPKEPASVE